MDQFVRNADPLDSMKLGHYRERIMKTKEEELSFALIKIFSNQKFFQPEIETQSQYDEENDIFQVQARMTYKGYWFVLDWKGNPKKNVYSAIWGLVAKAPQHNMPATDLSEAAEHLKRWIQIV